MKLGEHITPRDVAEEIERHVNAGRAPAPLLSGDGAAGRFTGHVGRYEFQAGRLAKIDGHRPEYMDGHRLIAERTRTREA